MKSYITLIVLTLLVGCASTPPASPFEERVNAMSVEEAKLYVADVQSCVKEAESNGEPVTLCFE